MTKLSTLILAIVSFFAPVKTTASFEDRVQGLIDAASQEAEANYEKAAALTGLANDIAVNASRTRAYASKINGLAGRLEGTLAN